MSTGRPSTGAGAALVAKLRAASSRAAGNAAAIDACPPDSPASVIIKSRRHASSTSVN